MFIVRKHKGIYTDKMPFAEQAQIFQEYAAYERDGFAVEVEFRDGAAYVRAVKRYEYLTPALREYKAKGFEVREIRR